ncbi:MAG: hypothetical protein ACLFSV_05595 [Alkalispirochaeta sp.]
MSHRTYLVTRIVLFLFLACCLVSPASAVFHDGSFAPPPPQDEPEEPEEPDDPDSGNRGSEEDESDENGEDSEEDNSDEDSSDSNDDGNDGGNSGSDNDDDRAIVAEIEAETLRVLDAIDTAAEEVAQADVRMRNILSQEGYRSVITSAEASVSIASRRAHQSRRSLDSVLLSSAEGWEQQQFAVARTRTNLERELSISQSPSRGDPVRVVDGAYLSVVPLPVLKRGNVSFDLSLRYDSRRVSRGTWGTGWSDPLAARVVQGSIVPPSLEGAYRNALEENGAAVDAVTEVLREFLDDPESEPSDHRSAIEEILTDQRAALDRLDQHEEQVRQLLSMAERHGASTTSLQDALATATDLRDETSADRSVALAAQRVITACQDSRNEIATVIVEIKELLTELTAARDGYNETKRANEATLYPGEPLDLMAVGATYCTYVDESGGYHLFEFDDAEEVYRSPTLPHVRLVPLDTGWEIRNPDGIARTFDAAGRISGIIDRDGYGFRIVRSETGDTRTVQILDSAEALLGTYRFSEGGDAVLTIPTLADTRFTISDRYLRAVEGPRGSVEFEYTPAGLSSIFRDDGTRTRIEYAGDEERSSVVSVTYPSGSKEYFEYPSSGSRIYRDPDGVETVLSVSDDRVTSVTDSSGYRRELTYDSSGRLVEIRDNRGDRETRRYDEAGALEQQQFTDGSWLRLSRNERGEPVAMESDVGTLWVLGEDESLDVTTITTPEDRYVVTKEGSARHITSDRGGEWIIHTDDAGDPVQIVRGDGIVERFEYDLLRRVVARYRNGAEIERFRYDDAGRLTHHTHEGRHHEYRYDDTRRNRSHFVDGVELERTMFDTEGRPIHRRYHDGTEEHYAYSAAGRVVEYRSRSDQLLRTEYNAAGLVTAVIATQSGEEWKFRYDPTGRRTVQITPDGSRFETLYGTTSRAIGTRFPDGSVEYDQTLPGGRVRRVDRLGGATMYRYDAAGRPVRILHDDGRDVRVTYDGGTSRYTLNGNLIHSTTHDPYGRILERRFSDGTAETYRYDATLLPMFRRDRRGGEERWEWDPFHRCTHHVLPDGREESWRYTPSETVYRSPSGEVSRTTFDPEGRVMTTVHGSVRQEYRYGPAGVLEISTDGTVEERRFIDAGSRLLGIPEDALVTAPVRLPAHPVAPGRRHILEAGTRREVELHWSGAIGTVVEAPGINPRRWSSRLDPYGRPSVVTTPEGRRFRFEWSREGALISRETPGGDPRRYHYDQAGTLVGWRDGTDEVTLNDDGTSRHIEMRRGGDTLRCTIDPYGAITAEERRGSVIGHTTSWERNAAGAVERVLSDVVSEPLEIEHNHRGARETVRAGSFTVTITSPRERSDGTEPSVPAIELSSDINDTRHSLAFHGEEIRYDDDAVRVVQNATESTITVRRRSGFSDLVDGIVYLRDESGRIVTEQSLTGTLHAYRYDPFGRIVTVDTSGDTNTTITETTGPGTTDTATRTDGVPATDIDRSELTGLWRRLVPTGEIPSPPLRLQRHSVARDRDGRIVPPVSSEATVRYDEAGRAVRIAGETFRYDPFTEHVEAIGSDKTAWTIERRSDGSLARITNAGVPWLYGSVEYVTTMGSETVTLRLWERTSVTRDGTSPETMPSDAAGGRYYAAPADTASDEEAVSDTRALEVRVNERPVAFLTEAGLIVPFCDIRGTIRGIYRSDAPTPMPRYTPHPDTQLPLTTGSSVTVAEETVHQLPEAIPFDTVISCLDHLPGTGALLSRTRTVSLTNGSFTSLDPDLNGYSWYEFARGDPINFQDLTGRYVVAVDAGHFQQDPLWAEDPLGSSEDYTIGTAGCKLVTVSNAINQVAGTGIVDPGRLNRALTDGYYRSGSLLNSYDVADVIADITRHEVAYVPVHPDQVDIERVIEAIADDPATRYVVSARIETHAVGDGSPHSYEHSLNVSGFDGEGRPIFRDTSNRNRTSIGKDERVLRYDVYATSQCRVY